MSAENNNQKPSGDLPEEMAKQAKVLVKQAFDMFAEQNLTFSERLARFNERQKEAEEKIKRGGYRTSGRIV